MNEAHPPQAGTAAGDLASLSPEERRALLRQLLERAGTAPRVAPMSFAQERLWFLDQLVPGNPFYNVDAAIRLRGALDVHALERSLRTISARHETLRTTFGSVAGRPTQFVHPESDVRLRRRDLTGLDEAVRMREALASIRDEARRPFELSRGPVLRTTLLTLAPDDHVLLLTMHHIVSDGWSMGVFVGELAVLYEAFLHGRPSPLPPLAVQYADYAQWQRQRLTGDALRTHIDYWTTRLATLPHLELPTDRPRPAMPTFAGGRTYFEIAGALAQRLRLLGRQHQATLFMTLLAAFQVLLHRYAGQDDIVVGTPIAGRTRAELESLIGFFVNTLVIRTTVRGQSTFRDLLTTVRDEAIDAFAHQDLPFERLVEELHPTRDLSRNPLCQVMFALQNAPTSSLALEGLEVSYPSVSNDTTRFDLVLNVWESADDDGLQARLEYSRDVFDERTVEGIGRHFTALLDSIVRSPDTPIEMLEILTAEDRRTLLLDWNDTVVDEAPIDEAVHLEVSRRAAEMPHRLAVADRRGSLTYEHLETRAQRAARYLRGLGVTSGSLVAVCVEPSVAWVVAQYAVLKTGGAFVAIDPAHPPARVTRMLDDARPVAVIAGGALAAALRPRWPNVLDAEQLAADDSPASTAGSLVDGRTSALDADAAPSSAAYVIYTSGSTGEPHGVRVRHEGLRHLVHWHRRTYDVGPDDRASQVAGPGFDASVWEVWPYLTAGASVHIVDPAVRLDPSRLLEWLADERISLAFLPTPLAEAVLECPLPPRLQLRALLTGGDRLRRAPRQALPFALMNHYGPTEYSVVATAGVVTAADSSDGGSDTAPPIGRPIANTRVYVLDTRGRLVPPRVPGQLAIAGVGLADGYLNRPDLTAERFVPNPFENADPSRRSGDGRMYLTGDRVRWRHDGQLEFLGRLDTQVSVRGFRVETAEIEAALAADPSVGHALVVAARDEGGDTRVIAYVVRSDEDRRHDEEAARERVETWRSLYESTYAGGGDVDPSFDITGWQSSYTGMPLPESDMREWVDATVARIVGLRPRDVFEIGVGTGLLLFRLAPHVERYVGVDFSAAALRTLQARVRAAGLAGVDLRQGDADALDDQDAGPVDLVILNSIAQYFPGGDHLTRVIDRAVSLVGNGGHVFVGDVRSLALQRAFQTSVELHRAPASMTVGQFRARVTAALMREEELLVAPSYFRRWQQPGGATAVSVLMKRGRHHNELTRFRYDVILQVGQRLAPETVGDRWLDWDMDHLTVDDVVRLLRESAPATLLLRGVPNARLSSDTAAMALLSCASSHESIGSVRERLMDAASAHADHPGVDVETLAERVAAVGYDLTPQWDHHGPDGRFDARLTRSGSVAETRTAGGGGSVAGRPLRPAPVLSTDRAPEVAEQRRPAALTNDPLQAAIARRLTPRLRQTVRSRLPEHMVPSTFVFLDAFPLTANGKIDRDALPLPAATREGVDGEYLAPRTPAEEVVAGVWAELLGADAVGVHDNFFELGGHSLLGMQLVGRLRDVFQVDLSITALFEAPTVAGLVGTLADLRGSRADLEQRALWAVTVSRLSDAEVSQRLERGTPGE